MAKTYTAAGTVVAGEVYTAAAHNIIATDVNNFIVPPMARLRLTANVSFTNSTHGTVGFKNTNATEDYDTDGMITLSGSNSAITINTAGVYSCQAAVNFAANVTGVRIGRIVRSRSAVLTAISTFSFTPTNGGEFHSPLAGSIECEVGDIIDLYCFQSSGGALNLQPADTSGIQFGGTWLTATWVGRTS
jgi:hypothetical protein